MKHRGRFARPLPVLAPETNKVSSAWANNLPTGFYTIYLTCLSVVNNVAVAAKKTN